MNRFLLALCCALLLGTASAQRDAGGSCAVGECPTGDNDPAISAGEVLRPAVEWDDANATFRVPWHEDPATIECGGRKDCAEAREDAVEARVGAEAS